MVDKYFYTEEEVDRLFQGACLHAEYYKLDTLNENVVKFIKHESEVQAALHARIRHLEKALNKELNV